MSKPIKLEVIVRTTETGADGKPVHPVNAVVEFNDTHLAHVINVQNAVGDALRGLNDAKLAELLAAN